MALETGTYTNDLVPANPVPSDGLGQADDHMRLIKSALKNTFAGFTSAPLISSQAQLDAAVAAVTGTVRPLFPLGTAGAPGITPIGDTDTGIYSPGANQMGMSCGGQPIITATTAGAQVNGNLTVVGGGLTVPAIVNTGAYSGGTGQLVPIGSTHIWHEDALPAEGGYCWANGGTLNRVTNPVLWARWGTKYGAGDGSTTFNVPNLCELVPVGQRAMGGASSRALLATGVLGTSVLGEASHTLTLAELPTGITSTGTASVSVSLPGSPSARFAYSSNGDLLGFSAPSTGAFVSQYSAANNWTLANGMSGSGTTSNTSNNTGGAAHNNVQPSTAVNFIIRIG